MVVDKTFDELEAVMEGETTYDTVKNFVKSNIVPLLSNFNDEDAILMFDIKVNVFLFAGNSTNPLNTSKKDIIDKYRNAMLETAKSFRGTVAFAHVDSDLEDPSRIFEFFDLTATQLPAIRLIKIKGDLIKYKYDNVNEISTINRMHFVQNCLDNKIETHYRSQKLPEDWNSGPVKTLVHSNIISVSHDSSKAVLVKFYAP
ncbi:hypothetical protein GJ496_003807 [Pomphorhynchus laevis]|nr:hypothetical protein GJ496_003807 [Pomphorhynchus laevis]